MDRILGSISMQINAIMHTSQPDDYECFECKKSFQTIVFSLNRQYERVEFEHSMPIISVEDAEGLTCYCSSVCMRLHFPKAMAEQNTPIPAQRPDLGPIEACAVCKGPVDMTRFHLAFELEKFKDEGWSAQPLWQEYVAVVCSECAPQSQSSGAILEAPLDEPARHERTESAEERHEEDAPIAA